MTNQEKKALDFLREVFGENDTIGIMIRNVFNFRF